LNGAGGGKEENNWFHRTEGYDVAAIPSTKRPTNQRRGLPGEDRRKTGWSRRTIEATTRDSSGQIHKRTEVVWMNKHFQKAQKTNQIAIALTKKESKQKN
jgi:hypothetical protein